MEFEKKHVVVFETSERDPMTAQWRVVDTREFDLDQEIGAGERPKKALNDAILGLLRNTFSGTRRTIVRAQMPRVGDVRVVRGPECNPIEGIKWARNFFEERRGYRFSLRTMKSFVSDGYYAERVLIRPELCSSSAHNSEADGVERTRFSAMLADWRNVHEDFSAGMARYGFQVEVVEK